jgi:hypothetical protein
MRIETLVMAAAVGLSATIAGGPAEAAVTHNKLASNKLASNKLASNKLASNRLASNALTSTRLEADLATAELLATADGREVYSYLIGCALPEGITIEADVPGAEDTAPPASSYQCANGHCVFPGSLGLAEDWIDHQLDPTGQGWVSACIFARVNFHDTAEAISLRGAHAHLTVGTDEAEAYTLEEGAFFGNLFVRDDRIDWNVCRGEAEAAGNEVGGLVLRDCTEQDPADPEKTLCGFHSAGDCRDYSPELPSPYACSGLDNGRCHATPGLGHWPASPPYRQVITVYVSN